MEDWWGNAQFLIWPLLIVVATARLIWAILTLDLNKGGSRAKQWFKAFLGLP